MNIHEAERVAAAANQLRPDWPTTSVLTLISKHLMDRPRRDVAVALAWVACESNTANPARVLELGPWWKAAGIEGSTHRREVLNPAERCGICAKPESRCQASRVADDDHTFEPDVRRDPGIDVPATVEALRAEVVHAKAEPAPKPTLDELAANPNIQALRNQLATTPAVDTTREANATNHTEGPDRTEGDAA